MTPHRYSLQIIERHLDTFGHVNNATYLELLEEARWDWITQNGYGIERVQSERKGPTILEVRLAFKRELRNRERIEIVTWTQEYSSKVGTVIQQILNATGELCCEAHLLCGLFDLERRRLIAPTPEWRVAVGLPKDSAESA